MLNIEQIKNIIKPNKKHYEIMINHDIEEEDICFFDEDVLESRITLVNKEPDKLRLYLARYYKVNYRWLEMTIENNAIELKHYLDIEITQQDIIDWLKTFTEEYKSTYLIPTKAYCRICVYTSFTYIDFTKKEYLCLSISSCGEDKDIFQAINSQEYWRLYNIIKNLKG